MRSISTLTETYTHMLDEDRKVNTQRFVAGFYARADPRGLERPFRLENAPQQGLEIAQLFVPL